jgi:NAD(P)-dependent dehydrogenase (short-subunit alcohol dehydrogenase family)
VARAFNKKRRKVGMGGVIVTGGFGALGAATAAAFRKCGWSVALVDAAPAPANVAEPAFGGVDLIHPDRAEEAFRAAAEALEGVDALVNVAGGFRFAAQEEAGPEVWQAMFDINLLTCANMCRVAAHSLPDGGAIVNVSAAVAEKAGLGFSPYAASKAGVARLTESLAAALGGRVRVNAVLPLILDTPQNRKDMPKADHGSWTAPSAVAEVIAFLASDGARAINGALIPVTAASRR